MRRPTVGGFTLVEVVVALVVLAVASAATAELLYRAAREGREADHRERVLWEAGRVADSLAESGAASPGSHLLPDGTRLEWTAGGEAVWVRATAATADTAWLSLPVPFRAERTTLGADR